MQKLSDIKKIPCLVWGRVSIKEHRKGCGPDYKTKFNVSLNESKIV